jgi:hypothetical protein
VWPAEKLLRLYPRAWRERYGDEFVAMAGPEPLPPQQVIDVVSGAIDAWLSADVRGAANAWHQTPSGGRPMMKTMMTMCERTGLRYTTRDSLIGAAVMILGTTLFAAVGVAMRRRGWLLAGEILTSIAFTVSLVLSLPFWLLKGQPWKAQVAVIGGTIAALIAISALAVLI